MATATTILSPAKKSVSGRSKSTKISIPRHLRKQAEALVEMNFAFMDSSIFKQIGIEKELFSYDVEPPLPLTGWYQPTREDLLDFVGQVSPRTVLLGHGEDSSRAWFEEQIHARHPKIKVLQPQPGQTVEV